MPKKKLNTPLYYTYQTKNLINGKVYVGVHKQVYENDTYIGCGVRCQKDAVRKKDKYKSYFVDAVCRYGYHNFKKEILCHFDSLEEAYEEEAFLITEKEVKDNNFYNLRAGGIGGGYFKTRRKKKSPSKETRDKMSKAAKGKGNSKWKGFWVTPMGTFISSREAAKACGVSKPVLIARCRGYRYQYYKGKRRKDVIKVEGYSFKENCGS